MAEENRAQKQQPMGSWALPNPEGEKSPSMNPPPMIGSSSNNNGPLIAVQNQQVGEGAHGGVGNKKTTARKGRGGQKKATFKATGGRKVGNGAAAGSAHIWTERERRRKMRNMFAELHSLIPHLPPKADKSTIVDEAVKYIQSLEITLENLEKKKQEMLLKQAAQQQQSTDSSTTIVYNGPSANLNSQKHPYVSREAFMADHGSSSSTHNNTIRASTPSLPPLPGTENNNQSAASAAFKTWSSANVVVNICGGQAQFNVCSFTKPGLFTGICTLFEKYKIEVLSAHVSSDASRRFYMIHAKANGGAYQGFSAEETFKRAAAELTLRLS